MERKSLIRKQNDRNMNENRNQFSSTIKLNLIIIKLR